MDARLQGSMFWESAMSWLISWMVYRCTMWQRSPILASQKCALPTRVPCGWRHWKSRLCPQKTCQRLGQLHPPRHLLLCCSGTSLTLATMVRPTTTLHICFANSCSCHPPLLQSGKICPEGQDDIVGQLTNLLPHACSMSCLEQ